MNFENVSNFVTVDVSLKLGNKNCLFDTVLPVWKMQIFNPLTCNEAERRFKLVCDLLKSRIQWNDWASFPRVTLSSARVWQRVNDGTP